MSGLPPYAQGKLIALDFLGLALSFLSLLVPPLFAAVVLKTLMGTAASLEHIPFSLASQMKEHLEAESKADYNQTSLSLVIP